MGDKFVSKIYPRRIDLFHREIDGRGVEIPHSLKTIWNIYYIIRVTNPQQFGRKELNNLARKTSPIRL